MTTDTDQDERDSLWAGFWADVRRDYAAIWPQFLSTLREAREEWWDLGLFSAPDPEGQAQLAEEIDLLLARAESIDFEPPPRRDR